MIKDLYKKYNIDKNRLSRDYEKNPISKNIFRNGKWCWESLIKEDLEYLFLELNLKKKDLMDFFKISETKLSRDMHMYGLLKCKPRKKINIDDNFYNKFNIDKNKLLRDYIKYPLQIVQKKGGKLELPIEKDLRYLIIDLRINKDIIADYFNVGSEKVLDWCKYYKIETPLKEYIFDSKKSIKAKGINKQYNIDYTKMTRNYIERPLKISINKTPVGYSIEMPNKEDFYYLFIELNMTRQEIADYFQVSNPQIKNWNRIFKCKKSRQAIVKNSMRNWIDNADIWSSKEEDEIYNLLIQKYSDTLRQHKSDLYPFYCDFYIPELDLYIEYQGHWSHGREPYVGSDKQNELLSLWISKNTLQYNKAISTWTIKDVIKREIAKKNNLNWIEFFNINEFMKWYENVIENNFNV